MPATEILAGGFLGGLGLLVGCVLCIPLFVFVKQDFDYPIAASVAWVSSGILGLRVGMTKGRQLSDAARLSRRLAVGDGEANTDAVMVDTSAVMDRAFLVLGRAGLLGTRRSSCPNRLPTSCAPFADAPGPELPPDAADVARATLKQSLREPGRFLLAHGCFRQQQQPGGSRPAPRQESRCRVRESPRKPPCPQPRLPRRRWLHLHRDRLRRR